MESSPGPTLCLRVYLVNAPAGSGITLLVNELVIGQVLDEVWSVDPQVLSALLVSAMAHSLCSGTRAS